MKMNNILASDAGFQILNTTEFSQSAVMNLAPGEASSRGMSVHSHSDQTLVVLQGTLSAEIGGEMAVMKKGDAVTVAAGAPHRFVNTGDELAATLSVYSPPAYPE